MRKLALLAAAVATLSAATILPANAQVGWNAGCYRYGLTGYHWYDFCLGPNFVYPHQRTCDRGNCYYH
jgi:hypothetical protein